MKLLDITPAKFSCVLGMCPGVYASDNSYVVVGKQIDASRHLPGRVAPHEQAVEIPKELLEQAVVDYLKTRHK
ncbi:MAG: hypothetical protein AAB552_02715 [Patescibacteria group bacterium]